MSDHFSDCGFKQTDALEDVFLGRLQQAGRFGTGARIMALRQMAVTVLICAGTACGLSMQASLLSGIAVSLLTGICMLVPEKELLRGTKGERKDTDSAGYLMREVFRSAWERHWLYMWGICPNISRICTWTGRRRPYWDILCCLSLW